MGGDEQDRQPAQERRDKHGQRQDLRAGEQRCRNGNGGGQDGRCQESVLHRRCAKDSIGAERYAAYSRLSMLMERRGGKKRRLLLTQRNDRSSTRRATSGSMRVARRAGREHASSA